MILIKYRGERMVDGINARMRMVLNAPIVPARLPHADPNPMPKKVHNLLVFRGRKVIRNESRTTSR